MKLHMLSCEMRKLQRVLPQLRGQEREVQLVKCIGNGVQFPNRVLSWTVITHKWLGRDTNPACPETKHRAARGTGQG